MPRRLYGMRYAVFLRLARWSVGASVSDRVIPRAVAKESFALRRLDHTQAATVYEGVARMEVLQFDVERRPGATRLTLIRAQQMELAEVY